MTSSQPVITPNALNFTPDNKHVYAYSGGTATVVNTDVALIEFTTQSEYVIAKLQFWYDANGSGSNIEFKTSFNNVKVATVVVTDSFTLQTIIPTRLVIPPFTAVLIEAKNFGGTEAVLASLTGKAYGMTETGYQ